MGGYSNVFMPQLEDDEAQPMDEQFRPQGTGDLPDQANYGFTPRPGTANSAAEPPAGSVDYPMPPVPTMPGGVSPGQPTQTAYQQIMQGMPQIDPSTYQAGPATQAYRQMLANQPTLDQYAPSIGRRIGAAVAGAGVAGIDRMHGNVGLAAQEQQNLQNQVNYGPYQRAVAMYQPNLEKAAQLAQGEQAAQAVQRQVPVNQALMMQRASKAAENLQQGGMYSSRAGAYQPHSLEEAQALKQSGVRPATPARPILDTHGQVAVTMGPDGKPTITPYGPNGTVNPITPPRPYVDPRELQTQRDQAANARQNASITAANNRQKASIAARQPRAGGSKPATPVAQAQAEELANRHIASTNPDFAKYVSIDAKSHKAGVIPPKPAFKLFGPNTIDPKEQQNYNNFIQARDAERDKILGGGKAPTKNYSIIMPGASRPVAPVGKPEEDEDEEDPYELTREEDEEENQ